jgi:hypothetical protein
VRAGNVRRCVNERGDVLQLVAEAVRAAALVKGTPAQHAAAEVLVERPAVEIPVERFAGGAYSQLRGDPIPVLHGFPQFAAGCLRLRQRPEARRIIAAGDE